MPGKITELAALTGAAAATTDLIEAVDISDTSMAASGTNKKMTLAELVAFVVANGTLPSTSVSYPGAASWVPGPTVKAALDEIDGLIDFLLPVGQAWLREAATTPAGIVFREATNNGINFAQLTPPAAIAANAVVTLPGVTGTLATLADVAAGGTPGPAGIVQQPTPPTDTSVLWADTDEVGIEENARYLKSVTATAYTLILADRGKLIQFSNAGAQTVTVPTNATAAFVIGTQIDLVRWGAGSVTLAGAGGVTVRTAATLALRAQYSGSSLIKMATDEWWLTGDLSA